MKDGYPRTVSEFAEYGKRVVVSCYPCGVQRVVAPDVLSMVFGADFDCYSSTSELRRELRCECCGERDRQIEFFDEIELQRLAREATALQARTGTR